MKLTKEQEKIYKQGCIDSHEQELSELQESYPHHYIKDFFYSTHLGVWLLQFDNLGDEEYETKAEMYEFLKEPLF